MGCAPNVGGMPAGLVTEHADKLRQPVSAESREPPRQISVHSTLVRKAAKKIKGLFLVARPLRPYIPPSILLATFLEDFLELQKKFFFF